MRRAARDRAPGALLARLEQDPRRARRGRRATRASSGSSCSSTSSRRRSRSATTPTSAAGSSTRCSGRRPRPAARCSCCSRCAPTSSASAASVPGLGAALEASTALLGPMDEPELRTAIEGPARIAGLKIERGLVDLMLRDVAGEPGSLPLLSHALLETWKRRTDRTLTLAGYRECGGVRGAIARTAESVYVALAGGAAAAGPVGLPPPHRARRGHGGHPAPRRARRAALRGRGVAGARAAAADARPTPGCSRRASTPSRSRTRRSSGSGRGCAWLDEDREGIRTLRHVTDSARSWDELGRDPAELYRGPRLVAALDCRRPRAGDAEPGRARVPRREPRPRAEKDGATPSAGPGGSKCSSV